MKCRERVSSLHGTGEKEVKNLKKIVCLILMCIILTGCSSSGTDAKRQEPKEEITYSYEDVDATITYIDMRKWFAICPRWQWEIEVEYDGITYEENDSSSGGMNRPSFADSRVGDSVRVEVVNRYTNGELTDRRISEIK